RDHARHGSERSVRRDDVAISHLTIRRAVVFGAPLLAYLVSMFHPTRVLENGTPWAYIAIHLGFAAVLCLLAWMFVLLVDGVPGVWATAVRVLAIPFAVAYTLYTAYSGVTVGALVWKGRE